MKTDLKKSGRISTIKLFRPSTKDELQDAIDDWVNDSQVNTFNNVNISNWDTSLITDMSEIFKLQSSFNEDISGWDVSNVNNFNEMFKGATSFNKNLDNWILNSSNYITMNSMFDGAISFNGSINNWNVDNVTEMNSMFWRANNFNKPINNWNVSGVQSMNGMFGHANSFNQDLSNWTLNPNCDIINIFSYSTSLSEENRSKFASNADETIYVSSGFFQPPYYRFYENSNGTNQINNLTLDISKTYKFQMLSNSYSHPFYMYNTGSNSQITINGSSLRNGGSFFTLTFNGTKSQIGRLYYFCTAHSFMNSEISLVNSNNSSPILNSIGNLNFDEGSNLIITLNASDADNDSLTFNISGGSNISSQINGNQLTFSSNSNWNGTEAFTVTVSDGSLEDSETFNVTVNAVNDPPVANNQSVITNEDTAKSITLTGSDIDGNALTYIVVTNPSSGTLTGTAPNLTYTPDTNYNGNDSFTFKVNDGTIDSAEATVSITINAVNNTPIANAQTVSTNEDTAKSITLTGSDIDGNALTYIVVTNPSSGTLTGTAPNLTYTPDTDYNGNDSFTFKVNDGIIDSAEATVSITINAVNDPPVAMSQYINTTQNTSKYITLSGSDIENDSLQFSLISSPNNGSLEGQIPNLLYKPNTNFFGMDQFTFRVFDGEKYSEIKTIYIYVQKTIFNDGKASFIISGDLLLGSVLNVIKTSNDPDGNGTFLYKWYSSPNGINWNFILSKYSNRFTLGENEVNQYMRCIIEYNDGDGFNESVTINTSQKIESKIIVQVKENWNLFYNPLDKQIRFDRINVNKLLVEYDLSSYNIVPANTAFWIKSNIDYDILLYSFDHPNEVGKTIVVPLGWSIIGVEIESTLDIQNILIYEFTSDGYKSNNGILKPFIGYWIYSDEERTIII